MATKKIAKIESANGSTKSQVINVPTSSDAVANLQVGRYENVGAGGKVLRRGYEIALVASDDSLPQPQSIVVTFTAEQARNMAKSLLAISNSVDVKNAQLRGIKTPF